MEKAPYSLVSRNPLIVTSAVDKEANVVAMLVQEDGIHFGLAPAASLATAST